MEKYVNILETNNQQHLLKYIEKANDSQKENLIKEIESLDFEQLQRLYETSNRDNEKAISSCIIEHTRFTDKYRIGDEKFNMLKELGETSIKNGEYAVVTMAGGQGTRLGHNGPKGTFLLNINPKPKYLFEIIADNLKRTNEQYGITLNWYIMTSSENNGMTVNFFKEHTYFGYPKENIKFFEQANLPLLSDEGKLLVDSNFHIKFLVPIFDYHSLKLFLLIHQK